MANNKLIRKLLGRNTEFKSAARFVFTFTALGSYEAGNTVDGHRHIPFDMDIESVKISRGNKGSSGTTEVDVKQSANTGSGGIPDTSVFDTKTSLTSSDNDWVVASNGVLNATNKLLKGGDLIRMNIISNEPGASDLVVEVICIPSYY